VTIRRQRRIATRHDKTIASYSSYDLPDSLTPARRPSPDAYGRTGVIEFLVANGGDLTIRDKDGKTSLQHAMGRESTPEAQALLRKLGAKE
jgi:ankyrin repeat protein